MPSTNTREKLFERDGLDLYGAGGEPPGEPSVLGTDVEIGGVSPGLEP